MTSQTITLDQPGIEAADYPRLRAAIASAKVGGITTTVIVDGEPAAEIRPPGQDRAADVLRTLVLQNLTALTATLDEPETPIVLRVTNTLAGLRRLRHRLTSRQPGTAAPGQHLTWHEGKHDWLDHDGYPRHKHDLYGRRVTGENGPYLDRRSSDRSEPDLAGVLAAMALRLGEELHTLGEVCDAAGMTRRRPNEIANWLLYGDRP
jgi:hypothetical protein